MKHTPLRVVALLALGAFALALPQAADARDVEVVARLSGPMPTGITVAAGGRIFVNFPQWGDRSALAVAELKNGKVVPYPDAATNRFDPAHPGATFSSVQSVVADGAGRLWVLDTGAPGFGVPIPGAAKLLAIDLDSGKIVRTILVKAPALLKTTYLNDVRLDLRQGRAGFAYITDSSISGPGGIIVVDLASGKATRRLSGHVSTSPDPDFRATIEGRTLMNRPAPGAEPSAWNLASDGIAISPDGETLYYCALTSRRFYSVPTRLLRDPNVSEAELEAHVTDLGLKGPSDGLSEDTRGYIYAGDFEKNEINRYDPASGRWTTLAQDDRFLWPDTLSISDGWLYFTANQLYRQAGFNEGKDLRQQPYEVLRLRVGAEPVLLK